MSARLQYNNISVLKQDLARLPDKMLDYAFEVLMERAQLMKGYAQVYVPVDTGSLRDSIRVERGGTSEHWRRVRVRAGGYKINPKSRKIVDYAVEVEYGTSKQVAQPYMRPAWDQVRDTVADMIKAKVVENVNP